MALFMLNSSFKLAPNYLREISFQTGIMGSPHRRCMTQNWPLVSRSFRGLKGYRAIG